MPKPVTAIVGRLDTIDGYVGRQEESIGQPKVRTATKDQSCQSNCYEIAGLSMHRREHQGKGQLSNQAVLKIAVIATATVMTMFHIGGPIVEKLLGLVN